MKKIKSVMIFLGTVSIGALIFLVWMCALTGCAWWPSKQAWEDVLQSEIEILEQEIDKYHEYMDTHPSHPENSRPVVYLDLFNY